MKQPQKDHVEAYTKCPLSHNSGYSNEVALELTDWLEIGTNVTSGNVMS